MTIDQVRRLVRPFPDDDPLCYPELSAYMVAARALMAVLADTGAAVTLPEDERLRELSLVVEVASGWRLRAEYAAAPEPGMVVLSARWVDAPRVPGPEPVGEVRA